MKKRAEKRDLERLDARVAIHTRQAARWAAEGDREMEKFTLKDARDLAAVRDAAARGDFPRAERIIDRLDSDIALEIPLRLRNTVFAD